jgi:ABC-type Fe3+-hydroxamate transport system substrate-binding protein
MFRAPFRTILYICIAVVIAACGGSRVATDTPPASTLTVTDDIGRIVTIAAPAERAISLAPSITEMVFAAGAGDRLVGVTSYCDFPAETAAIAKVGDTQSPNIESIVALRPQLVLVSTASQLESFMNVLEQQNIAVYVLDVKGLDDVSRGLRALGGIFGTKDESEQKAAEIERRTKAFRGGPTTPEPPKVFLQISAEPLFTIGADSFLTDLISRTGGLSVTREVPGGYPKLSKETALAMDPDVIVLSDSEDNREPNAVFANSPAVKNGRVHRIDADIISRPGPRLVDALEAISAAIKK